MVKSGQALSVSQRAVVCRCNMNMDWLCMIVQIIKIVFETASGQAQLLIEVSLAANIIHAIVLLHDEHQTCKQPSQRRVHG